MTEIITSDRASVPCGSCHLCCQADAVAFVLPEEDSSQWQTEIFDFAGTPYTIIAKKPNGDCVYLERGVGCMIHDRAPLVCRVYDCAAAYRMYGHAEAKRRLSPKIRKRARELIKAGYHPEPPPEWLFKEANMHG